MAKNRDVVAIKFYKIGSEIWVVPILVDASIPNPPSSAIENVLIKLQDFISKQPAISTPLLQSEYDALLELFRDPRFLIIHT